jgi:predicted helicase
MDRLKPVGFVDTDWPAIDEIFTFRSNGIVTYRDDFVYATDRSQLQGRIVTWLQRPVDQAKKEFGESALNKFGPASRVAFDESAIEPISYRPFDVRFLYNRSEYVDRQRPDFRNVWGSENIALFARRGTGVGPAVWCHGLVPDQHAFRGSYGGWVFPLMHHAAEGVGYFLAPDLIPGLSAAYGRPVEPREVFDVILALLSASSYTTRFAHDLEDDFPHVPFPADPTLFEQAVQIGARLRALQTFAEEPMPDFRRARLVGHASGPVLDMPTPQRAFAAEAGVGQIALLADRSLRVVDVSERAWQFSISGYPVLYRWLRARNGQEISAALQRAALETVGRIEETLHLFDRADSLLIEALEAPLTRAQTGLPVSERSAVQVEEVVDGSA